MSIRVISVECAAQKALSADPTDDDLMILRGSEYASGSAEGLHVREMLLAHDQYDRTFERFTPSYLLRFADTLPGKSVLAAHDHARLPLARFFRANVEQRRESGFPTLRQPGKSFPGQAEKGELVPGFEPRNRTVRWLKGGFYYPVDPDFDAKIEAGIYRSVSIGFRYDDIDCDACRKSYLRSDCPHLLGQELEDGTRVTGTYSGDLEKVEALEGSIVWLGAQPQARIIKSADGRLVDQPEVMARTEWGVDEVALKCYEDMARRTGCPRTIFAVPGGPPAQNPPPGPEPGAGDEGMNEQQAALEIEVAELRGSMQTLQPLADIGRKALDDAIARYLKAAARCGRNETEAKALAGYYGSQSDYGALSALAAALEAEALKFPSTPSADVSAQVDAPSHRTADSIRIAAGA